jgi:tRNA/rRNA methyltransferase
MKNCAISELRLVAPKQSHTEQIALRASSNSEEVLLNAKVYEDTQSAIADLEIVYASTARPRHQVKEVMTAEHMAKNFPHDKKVGFMFGCERTGLENEDIALANKIIEVPLNPEHASLNLAQAVLIVGYEYYKTTISQEPSRFVTNGGNIAPKEKVLRFLDMLNAEIKKSPRLKDEDHIRSLILNIDNIFTRAELTEQEVNSLYGVVNILLNG